MTKYINFPQPPEDKTGWPWNVDIPKYSENMPNGEPWPKISIITPNFNYGNFLEETIRSVLLQGYPNFEYIIMDGGSTDNSVDIIKKYEPWLTYWVSETDKGQADAINKGLNIGTGYIEAYLNSDDILLPEALISVASIFMSNNDVSWVTSNCNSFSYSVFKPLEVFKPKKIKMPEYIFGQSNPQSSTFWLSSARKEVGFDSGYEFCMDCNFFCELLYKYGFPYVSEETWSGFRVHKDNKSIKLRDVLHKEIDFIARKWKKKFGLFTKLKTYHLLYSWRFRVACSTYLFEKNLENKKYSKVDLLKMFLVYPPSIVNRQALGALNKLIISNYNESKDIL